MNAVNHRSRNRIVNLGEVFTPESYAESLLDQIDCKKTWGDENSTFFEPTCGHGNIVTAILKRRLQHIYKKALLRKIKNPLLYAIANSINTLWAIDIDEKNVDECRQRILSEIINFLEQNKTRVTKSFIRRNKVFFTHLFCALKWHIQQNECLASLSSDNEVKINASKTKAGYEYWKANGHHPIDFDLTWCEFFSDCKKNNVLPLEYKRSEKLVSALISGNTRGYADFAFAKLIIEDNYFESQVNATRGI